MYTYFWLFLLLTFSLNIQSISQHHLCTPPHHRIDLYVFFRQGKDQLNGRRRERQSSSFVIDFFYMCECSIAMMFAPLVLISILSKLPWDVLCWESKWMYTFALLYWMHKYRDFSWNECPFLYHEDPRQQDQLRTNHPLRWHHHIQPHKEHSP